MIINCLLSKDRITNFDVRTVSLKKLTDIRGFFRNHLDKMLNEGIMVGYPYKKELYFIGDEDEVYQRLNDFIVGGIKTKKLDIYDNSHRNIFLYLFNSVFIKKLLDIGFVPLKKVRKRKRLIPSLRLSEFIEPLGQNDGIYISYGIKFGTYLLISGKVLLFLDLYTPPCLKIGDILFPIKLPKDKKIYGIYRRKSIMPINHRYEKLLRIIELIRDKDEELYVYFPDGRRLSFNTSFISPNKYDELFEVGEIEEPILEFNRCYSRNPVYGLRNCKAYSYPQDISTSIFLLIDNKINREKLNRLLSFLKNGCKDKYGIFDGYQDIFGAALYVEGEKTVTINNANDVINEISKLPKSDKKLNIVIAIRDELAPKGTVKGSEFYRQVKSFCLKTNLRCQIIRESTLDKLDQNGRTNIIYNLSTALYTKSDGTPWKIPSDKPLAPSGYVIVGIAFTIDHKEKEIKAGVLYLFDRFGRHLHVEVKRYSLPLLKGLYIPYKIMKEMIEELKAKFPWVKYMIFHKSAPYHNDEINAIEDSLGDEIRYLLVYLRANIPIRIFDETTNNFTPFRGIYVRIKEMFSESFILLTTGNSHGDTKVIERPKAFGTPRPIEIIVTRNTIDNINMELIAQHILTLTKLDWNSCSMEIREPITTKYSRKAAQLLPLYEKDYSTMFRDIRDII